MTSKGMFGVVPQEICDLIYDELVTPEQGFKHKNLVQASKSLHDEVISRVLKFSEGFVKISYNAPGLEAALHAFNIPVLCTDPTQIADMPHGCMTVNVRVGRGKLFDDQHALLIIKDIELFALALQNVLFCRRSPRDEMQSNVPSDPIESWTCSTASRGNTAIKVSFKRYAVSHEVQLSMELRLLEPFRNCTSGQHHIIFGPTVLDNQQRRPFVRAISSRRMYIKATAWSYLIYLIEVKKRVDNLWDARDFSAVIRLAKHILLTWELNLLNDSVLFLIMVISERSQEAFARIALILLDITTCAFAAYLKDQNLKGMEAMLKAQFDLNALLNLFPRQSDLFDIVGHQLATHDGQKWCLLIMSAAPGGMFYTQLHDSLPLVGEASEMYLHDAAVFAEMQNNGTWQALTAGPRFTTPFGSELSNKLSINRLENIPSSVFRTESAYEFELPQGCDGHAWVDTLEEARLNPPSSVEDVGEGIDMSEENSTRDETMLGSTSDEPIVIGDSPTNADEEDTDMDDSSA